MRKKYKSKSYAEYSLQFWFDRKGTPNLLETSNMRKGRELKDIGSWNMHLFGSRIAASKLLDKEDKKMFAEFCKAYLEIYQKIYQEEHP